MEIHKAKRLLQDKQVFLINVFLDVLFDGQLCNLNISGYILRRCKDLQRAEQVPQEGVLVISLLCILIRILGVLLVLADTIENLLAALHVGIVLIVQWLDGLEAVFWIWTLRELHWLNYLVDALLISLRLFQSFDKIFDT